MIRLILMTSALTLGCGDVAVAAAARRLPEKMPKAVAPAVTSPVCLKLTADYENASKALAANNVKGLGDNSVPRATMREAENTNTLAQARLTVDLLKNNACKMPTTAPSATRYLNSALKCNIDKLDEALAGRTRMPESCDRSKWIPSE